MVLNDEDIVFLTQDEQELHMLQQLKIQSGESFDYKQGYAYAIFEVHKQYNLRRKNNSDIPDKTKKIVPNQHKKIKEASVSKILQILPRQNHNPSSPTIIAITPNRPSDDHSSTSIPPKELVDKPQNTRFENPHKEVPIKEEKTIPLKSLL